MSYYYDDFTYNYVKKEELGVTDKFLYVARRKKSGGVGVGLDYYKRKILEYESQFEYVDVYRLIKGWIKSGNTLDQVFEKTKKYKQITKNNIVIVYYDLSRVNGFRPNPKFFGSYRYNKKKAATLYSKMLKDIKKNKKIVLESKKTISRIFKDLKGSKKSKEPKEPTKPQDPQTQELKTSLKTSLITIKKQKIKFNFETQETIESFFSSLQITQDIPMIVLNGLVFKLDKKLSKKFVSAILKKHNKVMVDSTVFVVVRMKKGEKFSNLVINFDHGQILLNLNSRVIEKEEILQSLKDKIPNFSFLELANSQEYDGSFQIYDFSYNALMLNYAIMNENPYSRVFYIDERSAEGKRIKYNVNSIARYYDTEYYNSLTKSDPMVKFSISPEVNSSKTTYDTYEKGELLLDVEPPRYNYFKIKFNGAKTIKMVYLLREYVSVMFYKYSKFLEPKIEKMYLSYGLKLERAEPVIVTKKKQKLLSLYEDFNLSPGKYTRDCPAKRQPNKIEKEKYETLIASDIQKNRVTVVKSKTRNKNAYYYCESDEYPKYFLNKHGDPCCFKKTPKATTGEKEKRIAKKDYIFGVNKRLTPGEIAKIPNIFKTYLNSIQPANYFQLGCGGDESDSLVYCILDSLESDITAAYVKKKLISKLEEYNFHLQENPKLNKKEILAAVERCIVSNIFYNLLEIIFQINIFVFEISGGDKIKFEGMPKNYIRSIKYDKCMILIKKDSDVVGCSDYSLVISFKKDVEDDGKGGGDGKRKIKLIREKTMTKIFDRGMVKNLFELYNSQTKTTLIGISKRFGVSVVPGSYKILNYTMEFLKTVGLENKHQIIDKNGKLRCIVVFDKYFFCTLPVQPNPIFGSVVSKKKYSVDGPYPKIQDILSFVNTTPSSVTFDSHGAVTGLWFYWAGIYEAFYCPVAEISKQEVLNYVDKKYIFQEKAPIYIIKKKRTFFESVEKFKRQSHKIYTLVSWLYLSLGLGWSGFSKYLIVVPSINYDLSSLNGPLKKIYKSSLQIFKTNTNKIKNLAPSIIKGNRIVCKSQIIKDGLMYYLKNFERNKKYFTYLNYDQVGSYGVEKDQLLFKNTLDLQRWLRQDNLYNIHTNLEVLRSLKTIDPLIYYQNGKYYIIQIVKNSEFGRSLQLGYNWISSRRSPKKINTGYLTPKYKGRKMPNYKIFEVADGKIKGLLEIENYEVSHNEAYIKILNYDGLKYAAILPL